MIAIFLGGMLVLGAPNPDRVYEDEMIRLELPKSWQIEGEAGEYRLESDSQQSASLLLITSDAEQPLEARLAEIEQQFVSTGIITLESSEAWDVDDQDVLYRRYRLMVAGTEDRSEAILLHQFSFTRDGVQLLLQVESPPTRRPPKELIEAMVRTLEILRAPDPFVYEDLAP